MLEIVACDPARDDEFIRTQTRANFYAAMAATWDEARHQREPLHPDRYRMLRWNGETVGFFAVRDEPDHLYVQTIQLVPAACGQGIGTRVMHHIAELAGERPVRLRVFPSNTGARRLYERLGYRLVGEEDDSLILELAKSA